MSSTVITPAPVTNFAEFEAAGGQMTVQPAPQTAEVETPEQETSETGAEPVKTAPEPEAGEVIPQEKKEGKAKRPAEDRIRELVGERNSEREARARLEARIKELEGGKQEKQAEPAKPTEAKEAERPTRPKLSSWAGTIDDYEAAVEKYDDAIAEYLEKRAASTYEKRRGEERKAEQDRKINETWAGSLKEFAAKHSDYDSVIADVPLSELMVNAIKSNNRPDIAYYLGQNPEEAKRIVALSHGAQVFELGRIAQKLAAPETQAAGDIEDDPEETQTTQPVKVPAKLGATGGVTAKKPEQAKDFAEFEAIEQRLSTKRK